MDNMASQKNMLDMWCTARIEDVTCALSAHAGDVHARGFLMWDDTGWWSCRQYDNQGNYVFPGNPEWTG